MIGKRSGVGTRLRVDNKALINVYCICYRLVLVCGDVNDRIVYIKEVEKIFIQLWLFFYYFVKKSVVYVKVVLIVKDFSVSNGGKKKLKKRFKKVCRIRWLLIEKVIEGVYEDYEVLV